MRIDLLLKHLCLAKSRSMVKHWCDGGLVLLGDAPARASSHVRSGDRITIRYPSRHVTIEIRDIPAKQVSRADASGYYTEISSEPVDDLTDLD
jgi:ribosomal 50S subunit-recycling heat shock protein